MSRFARRWQSGILVLGVCLFATPGTRSADDDADDIKEAQKATDKLKKLVDAVAKRGEAGTDAKENDKAIGALKKTLNDATDLKHVMWAAYKPRAKGGQGVGEKAGIVTPDGIEAKLIALTKRALPAGQLQKEGPDLIRMAQVAQAIGEVADLNPPPAGNPKKPPAKWQQFNKEQKDGAKDLIDAVNANKPADVQTAATKLYGSCTQCHGVFR